MNPTLLPANASSYRQLRIGALVVAYLLPILIGVVRFGRFNPLALVYPSIHKALVLAAIGVQIFHLLQPEHARPRTVVMWRYPIAQEIALAVFGLVLLAALYGTRWAGIPADVYPIFHNVVDALAVALLFAFRSKTVVDGQARKITFWGLYPRSFSFEEAGFGLVEIHYRRAGAHVGTGYVLGLFPRGGGAPIQVYPEASAQDVFQRIQWLHGTTGAMPAQR